MISMNGPHLPSRSKSIPDKSNPSSSQKSDSVSLAGPSTSSIGWLQVIARTEGIKSGFNDEGSMGLSHANLLTFYRLQTATQSSDSLKDPILVLTSVAFTLITKIRVRGVSVQFRP
jgi:hypothetical protein